MASIHGHLRFWARNAHERPTYIAKHNDRQILANIVTWVNAGSNFYHLSNAVLWLWFKQMWRRLKQKQREREREKERGREAVRCDWVTGRFSMEIIFFCSRHFHQATTERTPPPNDGEMPEERRAARVVVMNRQSERAEVFRLITISSGLLNE